MARRPWPDELPDVFRGSAAVGQGVLSRAQLRDPRVRRLFQDVYAPEHVHHDHRLDCRGAALVVPGTARLTGRSLATALGVRMLRGGDPVEWVVPHADRSPGPRGLVLRAASSGPPDGGAWRGVPRTTALRMGFDLAARHPLEVAVGHLDAVASAGLLDLPAFRTWLEDRHDDDVVAVRTAAQLSDPGAASMPESAVRVRLRRADHEVVPQHVVRHLGRFVARVDLALVAWKVAVEYEGAWHGLIAEQLAKDRRRLDHLREAGWVVVHTTADMLRRHGMVEDAVGRAVAQQRAAGVGPR